MELLMFSIATFHVLLSFKFFTWLYNKMNWSVKNYKNKYVPYSIGVIFLWVIWIDMLFFSYFDVIFYSIPYLFVIWILGFIDDRYGKPYPKGLRGHFLLFINEKVFSTGLLKAVGVIIISIYYTYHFHMPHVVSFIYLCLLILFPHSMNLLDTKPLRVWKFSAVTILLPFIIYEINLFITLFSLCLFTFWFVYESRMKGMLGDNGAMLIGGIGAIIAIEIFPISYIILLLAICVFTTFMAEKVSIQAWLERTPIVRHFDQLGRAK
ncbi:hypothetical protein QA612_14435 [Evansella sp. AB-P1]|uniref:hypothetical protein n=1 Tax=Evansella sp. AB-P1 TaxID=3037653 RepID=UPI00241C7726|nr:hypothetical protein [Evansella sp. AB-P1]MDG5788675.1 hypothetical protein [Evansella sp. AB-P1]